MAYPFRHALTDLIGISPNQLVPIKSLRPRKPLEVAGSVNLYDVLNLMQTGKYRMHIRYVASS